MKMKKEDDKSAEDTHNDSRRPTNHSPFRPNSEKNRTWQIFYHSLKEHPKFSKTA